MLSPMKKIITVIAIFVFSFSALLAKNNHNYQEGDIVESSLEFEQGKYKIPLPDGKWEIGALNIYMNNTNSDLSDLKGKMSLWKKIRTINFS